MAWAVRLAVLGAALAGAPALGAEFNVFYRATPANAWQFYVSLPTQQAADTEAAGLRSCGFLAEVVANGEPPVTYNTYSTVSGGTTYVGGGGARYWYGGHYWHNPWWWHHHVYHHDHHDGVWHDHPTRHPHWHGHGHVHRHPVTHHHTHFHNHHATHHASHHSSHHSHRR